MEKSFFLIIQKDEQANYGLAMAIGENISDGFLVSKTYSRDTIKIGHSSVEEEGEGND